MDPATLPPEVADLPSAVAVPFGADRPYGTPVPGGVLIGADISLQLKVRRHISTTLPVALHSTGCEPWPELPILEDRASMPSTKKLCVFTTACTMSCPASQQAWFLEADWCLDHHGFLCASCCTMNTQSAVIVL